MMRKNAGRMKECAGRLRTFLAVCLAVAVAAASGCGTDARSAAFGRTAAETVSDTAAVGAEVAALADERKSEETNRTTSQLYAQAAVLMDADNGRVLLGKNEDQVLPMASTTKIMTCILVLEAGNTEEIVGVSSYAAGQPKVHLGARKGEYYKVSDLLYSLMLESHNDAAVILAEHYGSKWGGLSEDAAAHSEEESRKAVLFFTQKMNEKAKELGAVNTFFVTPNGLDATWTAEGDTKEHSTTASDLARIMSYCIAGSPARKEFLAVTQTQNYTFLSWKKGEDGSFLEGAKSVSCNNHNAFLQMMDGALSGKTGFTGKAGYCYVGALTKGGKTFCVALLACGWPNNRSWKWHDAKLMLEYGLENYQKKNIYEEGALKPVEVRNGQQQAVSLFCEKKKVELLLGPDDEVEVSWQLPSVLEAPVEAGTAVGKEIFWVNGTQYMTIPVVTSENVPKIDFPYCVRVIMQKAFL